MKFLKAIILFICLVSIIPHSDLVCQERLIKPGDALEIVVFGYDELHQVVPVNSNGTINYPALQGVPVDGISLQRFQKILVAQLSRHMERTPMVMVKFSESYPINVTVLGQVVLPGLYPIASSVTLQGAIGAAGGFISGAQLSKIKLIRMEDQNKTEIEVNLENLYKNGDPSSLPLLKDGDIIVVPGNPLATNVKVLGCVENPGSYEVFFQTTVLDVLFMAGGPTDDANLNKIKIASIGGQDTREVRLNIKEILKENEYKNIPIVGPGYVVFVPQKIKIWGNIMGFVRDVTTFAMLYYVIVRSRDL